MSKRDLILLALEDATVLLLMQRALRAASYEVAVAQEPSAFEKIIQESVPALLLISEKFGGQSGIRWAAEMLERFPTMPVILYAASDSLALCKQALQAGLTGYLCPPLRNDDIVKEVERSLAHARRIGDWLRREVKKTTASLEKRAALSEAERKRFEHIFANIQDGVIILDDEGRIQFVNRVVASAFELNGDWHGKPVVEVIEHPDIYTLVKRAKMVPLKYHEISFDDGRIFNAQYTPIEGVGAVITMQDISYLKQLDRMKNEFIHTVSHDLRSPLTSVLGYTELIERVGALNEQQVEFINRIRISVESITSMVNDLLDMSRLEAGFDARRDFVHPESTLKFALDTVEGQLQLNNLTLVTDIQPDLPNLRGNPIRLRQLFDNLIGNAIKYSPPGGMISVSLHAEGQQIIFKISDQGPGILPQEQNRIFEKFYRASNTPEGVSGSGLGLAIVKSIVDAYQGRIWVESAPGKGSTFFVVLPAADVQVKR
ncbi:MAG: sensory box histidine kinase PhoR [Anaerolineales bacterium]